MASTGFNWDMVDSNLNGALTTPPSDLLFFDPSAMLQSSELSMQLEILAAEFLMDHTGEMEPIAFMFDNDDMVDVDASVYDSDSTASTATIRSATSTSTAAAAAGSFSREERRKTKQRCYEKNYRGRVRDRRIKVEETWIQLEREFRNFLLKRASIVPQLRQSGDDDRKVNIDVCVHTCTNFPGFTTTDSETTNALHQKYIELQNEEIALRYHAAYYKCLLAWVTALNFWGGQTDANRRVREQINALPSLLQPRRFEFQW